jgi:hypothetical protein
VGEWGKASWEEEFGAALPFSPGPGWLVCVSLCLGPEVEREWGLMLRQRVGQRGGGTEFFCFCVFFACFFLVFFGLVLSCMFMKWCADQMCVCVCV